MTDHGLDVDAIILDFSKAFDKVSHNKLLYKLANVSINRLLVKWIEHWLNGRRQQVIVNGEFSDQGPVTSGVP